MKIIEKLVSESERTVNVMTELSKKVDQISSMAEVIRNISNQTNLLALNAAIESARTGEHGKGFGVIAQEIRKLNDNITTAALTINDLTEDILFTSQQAIRQTKNVSIEVDSGKETIEQADFILRQIGYSTNDAAESIKRISELALEQQDTLHTTLVQINETAAIAHTNATSTQQVLTGSSQQVESIEHMANTAQELANAAIVLRDLISQFKV